MGAFFCVVDRQTTDTIVTAVDGGVRHFCPCPSVFGRQVITMFAVGM